MFNLPIGIPPLRFFEIGMNVKAKQNNIYLKLRDVQENIVIKNINY